MASALWQAGGPISGKGVSSHVTDVAAVRTSKCPDPAHFRASKVYLSLGFPMSVRR